MLLHPCKLQSSLNISFELSQANRFAPNSRLLRKHILSFARMLLASHFSFLHGWIKLSTGFVLICSVYPLSDGHWHSKFKLLLEMQQLLTSVQPWLILHFSIWNCFKLFMHLFLICSSLSKVYLI